MPSNPNHPLSHIANVERSVHEGQGISTVVQSGIQRMREVCQRQLPLGTAMGIILNTLDDVRRSALRELSTLRSQLDGGLDNLLESQFDRGRVDINVAHARLSADVETAHQVPFPAVREPVDPEDFMPPSLVEAIHASHPELARVAAP